MIVIGKLCLFNFILKFDCRRKERVFRENIREQKREEIEGGDYEKDEEEEEKEEDNIAYGISCPLSDL